MSEEPAPQFTREHFAGRVGERFAMTSAPVEDLELQVHEVRGLAGDSDAREPFSVIFLGPMAPILPQAIYALEHAELGALQLFLVPVGPDKEQTGIQYEAVFS